MALTTTTGMITAMDAQDLQTRCFTGGMAQTNGYLLKTANESQTCLLIDAPLGISEWLDRLGEQPTDLLLTHQHYDHIEDVAKLVAKGIQVHAYAQYSAELTLEKLLLESGIAIKIEPYLVNHLLEGESQLEAGGLHFELQHVPGHSTDSVVFIHGELVFGGDTLFAGGIGRADLPGGDMELLLRGISNKMLTLPAEARVFPGHGPETTIGEQKATNPFL